jgi:predicted NAD-dependent protein-ADP-ribosyltransferase YbiA (DUF1768 family)
MTTIEIFNPQELPFGLLSNNSKYFMELDDEKWTTVTQYVYTNLLNNMPIYRDRIKKSHLSSINSNFKKYYTENIDNIIVSSIIEGLRKKFEKEENMNFLLTTGNSPIYYISENELLGTGISKNGLNIVGKLLVQLRNNYRYNKKINEENRNKERYEDQIYNAYIALAILEKEIEKGNNLSKYMYLTFDGIFNKYRINNDFDAFLQRLPPKNIVVKMYNDKIANLYPILGLAVEKNILVEYVRKKELKNISVRYDIIKKNIIFKLYLDYILRREFPGKTDAEYNEIKEDQILDDIHILIDKIYKFYNDKKLPADLLDQIYEKLKEVNSDIPTIEDIEKAEKFVLPEFKKPIEKQSFINNAPIEIFPFYIDNNNINNMLSPAVFSSMININDELYPTVLHYSRAKLLETNKKIGTIKNAYKILLINPNGPIEVNNFHDINALTDFYIKERDLQMINDVKVFAEKATNKKFEDRSLQELLVLTKNAKIVFKDFNDNILGVGNDGRGENYTGIILMNIRNKISKIINAEKGKQLKENDINEIFNDNTFMQTWLKMRVNDMCKTINTLKYYNWKRNKVSDDITPEFINSVLDKIYQPCSHLTTTYKDIIVSPPPYFVEIVNKAVGFKNSEIEIIDTLWKHIAIMFYFLINYVPPSTIKNIQNIIGLMEYNISNKTECINIVPNKKDNCIASAIINLLQGIKKFNQSYLFSDIITKYDIELAISLILNNYKQKEVKETGFIIMEEQKGHPEQEINVSPVQSKNAEIEKIIFENLQDIPEETSQELFGEAYESEGEESEIDYPESEFEYNSEAEQSSRASDYKNTLLDMMKVQIPVGGIAAMKRKQEMKLMESEDILLKHIKEKEIEKQKIIENQKRLKNIELINHLRMLEINDPEIIALYIIEAIDKIKNYKMSNKIKTNRINFFATLK